MAIDIINKETGEVLTLPENTPDWVISNLFTMDVTKCTVFDTIMYFADEASRAKALASEISTLRGAIRGIIGKNNFTTEQARMVITSICEGQDNCDMCPVKAACTTNDDEVTHRVAWSVLHGIPYSNDEFVKEELSFEESLSLIGDFEDDAELPTIKVTVLCCDAMFKGEFESSATIGQVLTELGVPYDPAMDAVSTHGNYTSTDKKLQECAHGDSHMSIMVISKHISRSNA